MPNAYSLLCVILQVSWRCRSCERTSSSSAVLQQGAEMDAMVDVQEQERSALNLDVHAAFNEAILMAALHDCEKVGLN